jgi:hypothetical protein
MKEIVLKLSEEEKNQIENLVAWSIKAELYWIEKDLFDKININQMEDLLIKLRML